ncbi:MAG: hydrogenase expression/formation protein HypE [Acidobacteriota bacterium]|nr:hydrogenase expression/formation protein HypE [Acidobacteriota bacterium]
MNGRYRPDISRGPRCPLPLDGPAEVTLAHGGGGRMTQTLIEQLFFTAFRNPALEPLHDGAVLEVGGSRLAFSTDSFVVSPIFFPGGDVGSLAVHGTVNDLSMCGASPVGLAAGFILEEGLPMEDLRRVTLSMRDAAERVGVPIVTGDTKVVDRGKGDGVFINTTGIGLVPPGIDLSPVKARPGDVVMCSGSVGVHGIAIMSVREGIEFETSLESDSAPLHDLVARLLLESPEEVHVLRDPTRGGVASALNEIAAQAKVGIRLDERSIPVRDEVRGACEILGLDPLYVANEGVCLVIAARVAAKRLLHTMRGHPLGRDSAIIGEVVRDEPSKVLIRTRAGGTRLVQMMSGEQLPRIC